MNARRLPATVLRPPPAAGHGRITVLPPDTESIVLVPQQRSTLALRTVAKLPSGASKRMTFVTCIYDVRGRESNKKNDSKEDRATAPAASGSSTGPTPGTASGAKAAASADAKKPFMPSIFGDGWGGNADAILGSNSSWISGGRDGGVRNVEAYLQQAASGLFSWDVNLIVFTEPKLVERIESARRSWDLQARTLVVALPLEESPYAALLPDLETLYEEMRIPKHFSPTKDTPLYVMLTWHKFACLIEALRRNPFASDRFYWVDATISTVARPPLPNREALFAALEQEASTTGRLWTSVQIPHHLLVGLAEQPSSYYSQRRPAVLGAFFGGGTQHVRWLARRVHEEILLSLKLRWPALEEALMGRVWATDPQRFLAIERLFVAYLDCLQIP